MEERGKTGAPAAEKAGGKRPSRWEVAWAWVQVLARFPRAWVLAGGLLWLGFLGIGGLITESGNAFDLFFKPANPPIVWQPLDAAGFEDQEAGFLLGLHHYNKREFAKAEEVWTRVAGSGHAEARYRLGRMYDFGWGVEQDHRTAAEWYQKASDQGHAEAMASLAYSYSVGIGGEQNDERAAALYERAMKLGSRKGAFNFSLSLISGRGITQDFERAKRIRSRLMSVKYCKAYRLSGYLAANGEDGVRLDKEMAYRYLRTADRLGCGGGVTLFLLSFRVDFESRQSIDREIQLYLEK